MAQHSAAQTYQRHTRKAPVKARRVTALDGMRVLAMLAVVVYHANVSWLPGGFLGVTIFFTLSGYLITDGFMREMRRTGGSLDVVGFYKRRLTRLWPQMLLVVGATAILSAIFAPVLLGKMRGDTIPALLFFENWHFIVREQSYFAASGLPSPITHMWFLAVIMQFYLLWPWVMLLITRTTRSRTMQSRIILAMAVFSAILAALLYNPSGDPSRVYYGTDTRLAEILLGACLAIIWPTNGLTARGRAIAERLGGSSNTLLTDIFACIAFIILAILCRTVTGYSHWLYRGGLVGVALLTNVIIFAVVRPGSLLAQLLGAAPLVSLAKRSFGIYLWHYPLLLIMNPATRTTALPWWGWLLEAIAIALAVELSYQFVEEPIAALLTGKRNRVNPNLLLISVATMLLVSVVGGGLICVGPFWYEDGALKQATETTTQVPATSAAAAPPPAAPATTAAADMTISDAVKKASLHLQSVLSATHYTVNPRTGTTEAPVILIGDSVPAGAVDQFYQIFPKGYIDAVVGRQLYDAAGVYESCLSSGYNQTIVVFSCGDNGVATEDDVVEMIKSAGNRKVYLVTARVPLPLQDMNNELFRQIAARYDNVNVIDWYAWSEGHDDYFWDDGTHLRPEGAEAYVAMLRYYICGE